MNQSNRWRVYELKWRMPSSEGQQKIRLYGAYVEGDHKEAKEKAQQMFPNKTIRLERCNRHGH